MLEEGLECRGYGSFSRRGGAADACFVDFGSVPDVEFVLEE